MEYNTEEYKRRGSNVFTSADGLKYVQSKTIENGVYLKCAIFRNGCKGTAKLNLTRHLITPMHLHNHEVSEYKAGVYQLKAKCKTLAKQTQSPSLRSIYYTSWKALKIFCYQWEPSHSCLFFRTKYKPYW